MNPTEAQALRDLAERLRTQVGTHGDCPQCDDLTDAAAACDRLANVVEHIEREPERLAPGLHAQGQIDALTRVQNILAVERP